MLSAEQFNPTALPFSLSWANFDKLQKFYSMSEAETTSILLAMVGPNAEGKRYWSKFRVPKEYFTEGMVGETEEDDEEEEEDEPPPKKVAPPVHMPAPGYGEEVFEQFALDGAPLEEEGEEEEHEEDDPPVAPEKPFEVDVPSPTTPEEAAPWLKNPFAVFFWFLK